SITMLAPKQKYVVRPIQVLDPIDALLYAGVVRRFAPEIERRRAAAADGRVFSYRFKAETLSDFRLENTWSAFRGRVTELAHRYSVVVVADIADFFPNVYLHRLSNAIAALGYEREARV